MPPAATLPYPGDQLISPVMARALHADACRNHAAVAWGVFWDLPAYPDRYAARLATSTASPYLLLADTLAGIRASSAAVNTGFFIVITLLRLAWRAAAAAGGSRHGRRRQTG